MKKYHLWHHFKNEQLWFGVTNPGADFLPRSYGPVADAAHGATPRNLHGCSILRASSRVGQAWPALIDACRVPGQT